MTEKHHYERRPSPVLPPPILAAFAAIPWGVPLPSGAWRHWRAVASWQFAGFARVDVTSATAGTVWITPEGKKAAQQGENT